MHCLLAVLASIALGQAQTPSTPLEVGQEVLRTSEEHEIITYTFFAEKGARIEGYLEQVHGDFRMRLDGPGREKGVVFDYSDHGPEPIRHIALESGEHTLLVKAVSGGNEATHQLYLGSCLIPADDLGERTAQYLSYYNPRKSGTAITFVRGGEVEVLGARGKVVEGEEEDFTVDTPISPPRVTWASYAHACMELERQGLLNMAQPIREILPWYPDYEELHSVEMLIALELVIPDTLPILRWQVGDQEAVFTREQMLELLSKRQAVRVARDGRNTMHSCRLLMEELIAKAAGMPIEDAMRHLFLDPVGLTSSNFHRRDDAEGLVHLKTTVRDLSTWFATLQGEQDAWPHFWSRFCEWEIFRRPRGARGLLIENLPELDLIAVQVWADTSRYGSRAPNLTEALLEDWPIRHPGKSMGRGGRGKPRWISSPSTALLNRFCGTYESDVIAGRLKIHAPKGQLTLARENGKAFKLDVGSNLKQLHPRSRVEFRYLDFHDLEDGSTPEFVLYLHGESRILYRRID